VAKRAKSDLPVAPLPDLVRWWRAQDAPGVVIGGLAVALLGRPRMTRDIDALILLPEDRWPAFLTAAGAFGFVPRLPDALAFAHDARVLLLRHQSTGVDVDVAFGNLPFEEEAVARATAVRVAGVTVPLPTPEDLIIMKAVAHRERDLLDVEGLLAAHPDLDVRRVRRWVRAFADALDAPDLYDDLQQLLKRRPPRKPRKGSS
jgi:Nucleotidyl transferase AbiEii toxin, Type IV TA system